MKVKIEIDNRNGKCAYVCPFLDADTLDTVGECLLFSKALRPDMMYGQVDGWYACDACNKVVRKAKEYECTEND